MLDDGIHASVAEIAEAEGIGKSYVSRILRLALLAPSIVEQILDGRPTAGLAQFLGPFPVEWVRQYERLIPSSA
jgi:ParB-like chromosome segregation protein Spo0J